MQLLMRRPEIEGFIAISPPVGGYDFNFLSPCPSSGLIVQGDEDDIVKEADVTRFADKLSKQNAEIDYRIILGADHFFKNQMDNLNQHMDEYLKARLKAAANRPKRVKPDRRRRQALPL
jgi:alpha/beta superfamily hydrolase